MWCFKKKEINKFVENLFLFSCAIQKKDIKKYDIIDKQLLFLYTYINNMKTKQPDVALKLTHKTIKNNPAYKDPNIEIIIDNNFMNMIKNSLGFREVFRDYIFNIQRKVE